MRSMDAAGLGRCSLSRMAPMPWLLREYRARTEASSSGVTLGDAAATGGGTMPTPVTFMRGPHETDSPARAKEINRESGEKLAPYTPRRFAPPLFIEGIQTTLPGSPL